MTPKLRPLGPRPSPRAPDGQDPAHQHGIRPSLSQNLHEETYYLPKIAKRALSPRLPRAAPPRRRPRPARTAPPRRSLGWDGNLIGHPFNSGQQFRDHIWQDCSQTVPAVTLSKFELTCFPHNSFLIVAYMCYLSKIWCETIPKMTKSSSKMTKLSPKVTKIIPKSDQK